MATHELWDGGPANSNLSRAQYPSFTYSQTNSAIKAVSPSVHYGTPYAVMRKVLDFEYDMALRKYFTDNAVAASDKLNVLLIPARTVLVGAYVEVESPTGITGAITASFATAGGILLGDTASAAVALDLTAASTNFSAPNAPWISSANAAMSLATAEAMVKPDMVQITLASLANAAKGLGAFGSLRLNVSAMVIDVGESAAANVR